MKLMLLFTHRRFHKTLKYFYEDNGSYDKS